MDVVVLADLDEVLLRQVGVVLDLQGGWRVLGVAQDVHEEGAVVVGDADGFGEALVFDGFDGVPGLLEGGLAGGYTALLVVPV